MTNSNPQDESRYRSGLRARAIERGETALAPHRLTLSRLRVTLTKDEETEVAAAHTIADIATALGPKQFQAALDRAFAVIEAEAEYLPQPAPKGWDQV